MIRFAFLFILFPVPAFCADFLVDSPRIAIWREYGPAAGDMRVCEDGKCRVVSNYSYLPPVAPQPFYMRLPADTGRVSVSIDGGEIDRVVSLRSEVLGPGTYEDSNPAIEYSGSWIHQHREGPSQREVHSAIEHDSSVAFTFAGTAVEIGLVTYDDRHTAELCIDGECRDIDIYSPGLHWRVPAVWSGLAKGEHHASLRFGKGKAIDLDWIRVIGETAPLPEGNHLGEDDRIGRSGESAFFDIEGSGATLRIRTGPDFGETRVCVAAICETHDFYSFRPGERDVTVDGQGHVRVEKGRARSLQIVTVTVH